MVAKLDDHVHTVTELDDYAKTPNVQCMIAFCVYDH